MATRKKSEAESALEEIGVRELRQNASKYLQRVKHGERFLITEWGHPIGILQPPEKLSLHNLIDAGFVTAAIDPTVTFDKPIITLKNGVSATELLLAARAAERS